MIGQDSQSSHKTVIFQVFGEKPHCTDWNKIWKICILPI